MTSEDDSAPKPPGDAIGHTPWKPPSPALLQGLLQGFEVIELIGCGGMGAVYSARQISLDRMVAIKLLPPALLDSNEDYSERFRHEARMMARLTHPGIISVFDFGESSDGQLYIVMEYVKGIDVAHMLIQQGKLQPLHALSIAAHVCDTLRYAHEQGIIHLDIKPANVMVDMEGRVKVADFGLASLAAQDTSDDDSTILGTPDYVAPEGLVMGVKVDHRADLYSLGVSLYEMLTGKVPCKPVVPPSIAVPGLDKRFDSVVKHALETDPNDRYQSAAIFRKDLDQILSVPVATPALAKTGRVRHMRPNRTLVPTARSQPSARRTPVKNDAPWALIIVVFIIIAGVTYYLLQNDASPKSKTNATEEKASPNTGGHEPKRKKSNDRDKGNFPTVVRKSPSGLQDTGQSRSLKNENVSDSRMEDLCNIFAADIEREATRPFKNACDDLDYKYAAALDREFEKVKDTADKGELSKLSFERSRAKSHTLDPPKDYEKHTSSELKRLRDTYWAEYEKLASIRNHAARALYKKHEQALSSLHDELVRTGKNNDAAEVDSKLKEVKQMPHLNSGNSTQPP